MYTFNYQNVVVSAGNGNSKGVAGNWSQEGVNSGFKPPAGSCTDM